MENIYMKKLLMGMIRSGVMICYAIFVSMVGIN